MEQQTIDMLMNLMANIGGALGGKGSWQEAVGSVAKSHIQSRNFAAMIQQLRKGFPPGMSMKVDGSSPDGKISFTGPADTVTENQHLPGFSSDVGTVNPFVEARPGSMGLSSVGGVVSPIPTPNPTIPTGSIGPAGGGFINPSMSPLNISGANLEGLTPENITAALQIMHGQQQIGLQGEELGIRKADLAMRQEDQPFDLLVKLAQVQHNQALSRKLAQGEPLDQPYPVSVPGVGPVTQRQWEHIPDKDRAYALYAFQASKLGPDAKLMSRAEWETYTPTDHIKMLKQMQIDPTLLNMEIKLRSAGATNINVGVEKAKALGDLQGELFFGDPKWAGTLDTHMGSKEVAEATFNAGTTARQKAKVSGVKDKNALNEADNAAVAKEKTAAKASFIDDRIKAGGGVLVKDTVWDKDGKTAIWTVKWPSGTVQTIRYKIK